MEDLLDPMEFQRQDLRPIGRGAAARERLTFPPESQDLVIMNPPIHRTQDCRGVGPEHPQFTEAGNTSDQGHGA